MLLEKLEGIAYKCMIMLNKQVISGVKPDQKKKFISELQQDDKVVAMVGDGINDAAALASSHVGVAMGGGVGAASEVSSVVLMGNRLSQVSKAVHFLHFTCYLVGLSQFTISLLSCILHPRSNNSK